MSSYEFGVGDDATVTSRGDRFSQPGYMALHVIFRVAALLAYLFCSLLISKNFVTSFVVVVFLLSLDFWIVKNITGRKLAGLRWWNYVDEEGKSKWIYESRKPEQANLVNKQEARIFWIALVIAQVVWGILFFVTVFTFSPGWFILVCIANILNGANLFGYTKCKFGRKDAENAARQYLAPYFFRNAWGSMTSRFRRGPAQTSGSTGDEYGSLREPR